MKITPTKLEKVSDISMSMGQVFFASVFIEPLASGNFHWTQTLFGFVLSLACW